MQFISRNRTDGAAAIVAAGIFSASVQCIFLREYLSLFSGNEFIIGAVLSVWLCATGVGSLLAGRSGRIADIPALALAFIVLAAAGITAVRASGLLFNPGELIGPLPVFILCIVGEAPFAFVNGYLFGAVSKDRLGVPNPYAAENFGALVGAVITFVCVLLYMTNAAITAIVAAPAVLLLRKKPAFLVLGLAVVGALVMTDGASMQWKYDFPFTRIVYGREGEIVFVKTGGDSAYLVNGRLHKSTALKPLLEQAVHIPMAQRRRSRNVLVIFDQGHASELTSYPGLVIDRIESEPKLASPGSVITAPESFRTEKKYDVVFLGAGVPQTAATGRFYTVSFFQKMKKIMADSGIFTFTLPISENYQSVAERRMHDIIRSTLRRQFNHVLVFPGTGWTYMASDASMSTTVKPRVKTDYLESTIIPSVSPERTVAANEKPLKTDISTIARPIVLLPGLALWAGLFSKASFIAAMLLCLVLLLSIIALPKSREVLSFASTGFAVGLYSVALLLLYQSAYGLLYSRVSLLLCCLTLGFMSGTVVKGFPHADLFIGFFCVVSLGFLCASAYPPAILFYCAHIGMGTLAGAQFVSLKKTSPGNLYAADLVGGAIGMACSVALVPLVGIPMIAAGLAFMKSVVWLIGGRRNK